MPFSVGIELDFYIFLATCKKPKKSSMCVCLYIYIYTYIYIYIQYIIYYILYIYMYISDEAVHSQMARPRDDQADRNHHTTSRSNKQSRQAFFFLKRLF